MVGTSYNKKDIKRPVIGMFVEGLDDQYETPLFRYCHAAAIEAGAHFVCFSGIILRDKRYADASPPQVELLRHMAGSELLDGIIFPSMIFSHADKETSAPILDSIRLKPSVSIGLVDSRISSVECDNISGMKAIVGHLIGVHGVKKFGFAYDNSSNNDFYKRQQGFDDAISAAGLDPGSVIRCHFSNMKSLVQDGRPIVDAVVCADDHCAKFIADYFSSVGILAPYDVLITGFDGLSGDCLIPRITTAVQPFEQMCKAAVGVIMKKLKDEPVEQCIVLPSELRIFESCGCRHSRLSMQSDSFFSGIRRTTSADPDAKRPVITLSKAVAESLASQSPHPFLDALDREIRKGFIYGRTTAYWQNRLSLAAEVHAATVAADKDLLALEKLIGIGRMYLAGFMERRYEIEELNQLDKTISTFGFAGDLAGTTSATGISREVVGSLGNRLSIKKSHVIFFNAKRSIPDEGRFVIQDNTAVDAANQRETTAGSYLAEILADEPQPCGLICNLLKCYQDPMGMSICEADIPDLRALLTLRNLVGNQIKTANLMEQVQNQADELFAANQQLVALRAKEHEYLEAIKFELNLARQIQADFLPKKLPVLEGWDVAVCFEPAKEVSGDFYDVFVLPEDRVGIVIADVSGKSVSAAIFMALVRSLMRALSQRSNGTDLLNVVPTVNDYIINNHNQSGSIMFVTLFFGVLDINSGWLEYVNAGHLPPVVLKEKCAPKPLKLTGPAIGISESAKYHTGSSMLKSGETLFAYTDGVTEAHGFDGKLLGKNRLYTVLEKNLATPASLIAAVREDVLSHLGGQDVSDDITMVAIKRL